MQHEEIVRRACRAFLRARDVRCFLLAVQRVVRKREHALRILEAAVTMKRRGLCRCCRAFVAFLVLLPSILPVHLRSDEDVMRIATQLNVACFFGIHPRLLLLPDIVANVVPESRTRRPSVLQRALIRRILRNVERDVLLQALSINPRIFPALPKVHRHLDVDVRHVHWNSVACHSRSCLPHCECARGAEFERETRRLEEARRGAHF